MEGQEFKLGSGAKLFVSIVPFHDAMALQRALFKSVKGIPLEANPLQMDLTSLKDAVLAVAASEEVEGILFSCMGRATYDGLRITRDLFDDPKISERARQDFYEICWKVIETNCKPFFFQLFSKWRELAQTRTATPK